jgi:hypothetical protein
MNANGPRIYLPPWVDPIDPNIDPILVQSMNALGTDVALELTAQGKTGVLVNGVYDLWSPARHYMLYAGIRVLWSPLALTLPRRSKFPTSSAPGAVTTRQSAGISNLGRAVVRLGDIVDYQLTRTA